MAFERDSDGLEAFPADFLPLWPAWRSVVCRDCNAQQRAVAGQQVQLGKGGTAVVS